jgi:hypothetical protein
MNAVITTITDAEYTDIPPAEADAATEYSIDDLAKQIIKDAMAKDVRLDARVDAFKALTTYRLGLTKLKKKGTDDDDDGATFSDIVNRIKEAG